MAVYGNVNVKYAPCKSVAQLHSAADYILGKKKEQLSSGVIKTKSELYNAFGCNRDNFANSVLMTRGIPSVMPFPIAAAMVVRYRQYEAVSLVSDSRLQASGSI